MSSLSDRGKGCGTRGVPRIRLSKDGRTVTVALEHAPSYATVRVVIRGHGSHPPVRQEPASSVRGQAGRPAGTSDDGHDAVVTDHFPSLEPSVGEETS